MKKKTTNKQKPIKIRIKNDDKLFQFFPIKHQHDENIHKTKLSYFLSPFYFQKLKIRNLE